MVHFDQSGHFIAPFHFTKLLSPVLLFCILCQTFSGLGQISSADCIIPFREWNFQNFNPEFLLNRKRSLLLWQSCALAAPGGHWCLHVTFAPRWPDNHTLGILDFIGSEQSGLPSIFLTAKPHVKMKSLHRMNVTRHFCSPDFDFFFGEFSTCTNNSCLSWV